MPSPTRKTRLLHLLTSRSVDTEMPMGVAAQFKTIYSQALFLHGIAEPNLSERAARETLKRTGHVEIWDRSRFSSGDEARYSPIGSMAIVTHVRVLTR